MRLAYCSPYQDVLNLPTAFWRYMTFKCSQRNANTSVQLAIELCPADGKERHFHRLALPARCDFIHSDAASAAVTASHESAECTHAVSSALAAFNQPDAKQHSFMFPKRLRLFIEDHRVPARGKRADVCSRAKLQEDRSWMVGA